MMLPTHVLVGLAIAAPLTVATSELATPGLVGALVGSVLPDLDVVAAHRRTLHYPTGYALAVVPTGLFALVLTTPATIAVAFAVVAAAFHCRMDRYGGGYDLRPWERRTDRAVYDHLKGRWRRAKRWTRYDGSPEDLLVAVGVGVPLLVLLDEPFRGLVALTLAIAIVYTAVRRPLATVVERRLG